MKIELVDFYPFEVSTRRPRLLAYADVKLDGKILIRGIRLYESKTEDSLYPCLSITQKQRGQY